MPNLNSDAFTFPDAPVLSCRDASSQFAELTIPLFGSMHNFAHYLSRSRSEADDLVQETYLKALRGFDSFETGGNLRSWMFRILKNSFLNSRTRAMHRFPHTGSEEILAHLPSHSLNPSEIYVQHAQLLVLESAIERLPQVQRDVLVLCDLEGESYRETAQALSIPIGTVMSRLARARRTLRNSLEEHIDDRNPKETPNPKTN